MNSICVRSRRGWLRNLLLGGLSLSLAGAMAQGLAQEKENKGGAEVVTDLKSTLEKGLRARLPREFAFIGRVVSLVDQGKLPRSEVMSTFLWARKKPDHWQATYFERAMRVRAARIGVNDI